MTKNPKKPSVSDSNMVDFQETLYYRSSHIKTKYLSSGAGHVVMFSRVAELITETCWTGFYRTSQ